MYFGFVGFRFVSAEPTQPQPRQSLPCPVPWMPMAMSQLPFGGAEYFRSLPMLSNAKATTHQVRDGPSSLLITLSCLSHLHPSDFARPLFKKNTKDAACGEPHPMDTTISPPPTSLTVVTTALSTALR
jgi:hypothetical protein